ncbi:DUF5337 domain-containing protein [Halocynthiibacter sp.]|uniref:DUF5337 domain-containing protein n=1 Tax=Halocynthiibacter sp. TaxID=1979210 RepID=UPI003C62E3E1
MTPEKDHELARRARMLSLVVAGAVILWLGGQWIGRLLGLPGRFAYLFDLMAIAAFVWVLVVAIGIWRARRDDS